MLLFTDGFDHYTSAQITRKWTSSVNAFIFAGNGRNGTNGLRFTGLSGCCARKTFTPSATVILGAGVRVATVIGTAGMLFRLQDLGSTQVALQLNTDLTLSVVIGSTVVATSVTTVTSEVYAYLEIKVVFGASGSVVVHKDGVAVITVASHNTIPTGNTSANSVIFGNTDVVTGPAQTAFTIDDFYIANGLGSVNNDFLGDVMVTTLFPTGAGDLTQWTPNSGSNWQNVDDPLAPDSSFNWGTAAGQVDLYAMGNLAATPADIFGVQWNAMVRKTDASSYVINSGMKFSTVHYGTINFTPNTDFQDFTDILDQNPDTSVDFTASDINGMQGGLRLYSIV